MIEASHTPTPVVPAAPRSKSRIFLVDDHEMFREGLRQLIDRELDFVVSGDAADFEGALKGISAFPPDLVITDISLPGTSGIDLIKALKTGHPELPVLVVSMHEESLYAERALRAGAMGYVMKQEPAKAVKAAIRKVLGGDIHLSEKMAAAMLGKLVHERTSEKQVSPIENLSNRELEVFRLLGQGKASREIALQLDLSVATINSFRNRIKEKLDLKNSTELILHAIHWVRENS
ncbi:MAG: response regulator transcription factor [Verrucomicrobiota bacterium]|jgi:DNA-binding NarL/FixJ family response regulator